MGNLQGHACGLSRADGLGNGLLILARPIARMRGVQAPTLGHHAAQLGDLLLGAGPLRPVFQPRGKAKGTLLQTRLQQHLHALQLIRCGRPVHQTGHG